ncbi:acyltransferase family protein [Leptospira noguchii]|nr:acyltransferase [Leptospira noguchii]
MIRKIFQYLFTPFLKNESEIQSLNGIRAVAILLVIVYHVWLPFEVSSFPNVLKNVISNFNSGVDLFFTLSGFLIYSGILKYRKNPNEFDKRKFILARSLRIFPPYYFCLFVLYLFFQGQQNRLEAVINPNEFQIAEIKNISESLKSVYADIFYVSNYTKYRLSLVGWSLSIEEQFYLILPFFSALFLFRFETRKRIFILAIIYFIPLLFRIYYILNHSDISVLIYSHTRMDSLLIGMILAEIETFQTQSSVKDSKFVEFVLIIFGAGLLTVGHAFSLEHWFRKTLGYNCFNIGYTILIRLALRKENLTARAFGLDCFRPVARLSYTMYLWNILIAGFAVSKVFSGARQPATGIFILSVLVSILFCFLISWILYLGIEKPFLLLKEKILLRKGYDSSKS